MKNGIFWAIKLMQRWYLLISQKFLFWTFQRWEIQSLFETRGWWKWWYLLITEKFFFELFGGGKYGLLLGQAVDEKMIFAGYREVPVLNISVMGNTIFFQPKSWWKVDNFLIFLSFSWYSRAWKMRIFVQWSVILSLFHGLIFPEIGN